MKGDNIDTDQSDKKIPRSLRESKFHQKGSIVWITGLSGAGKSTLSLELEKRLLDKNTMAYTLDGDLVRQGLNSDLGFSREDRTENIRRIGEVARLFADAAFVVIVAFISPFRKDRDRVRESMDPGRFVEVFLDCPLDVCERRDPKGLYQKARRGEIEDFTGISSPYEPPVSAEVQLKTDQMTVDQCINKIFDYLNENKVLTDID